MPKLPKLTRGRVARVLAVVLLAGTLAGCYVAPGYYGPAPGPGGGGGWCYHHPYRC